jgi:hypothetical protein
VLISHNFISNPFHLALTSGFNTRLQMVSRNIAVYLAVTWMLLLCCQRDLVESIPPPPPLPSHWGRLPTNGSSQIAEPIPTKTSAKIPGRDRSNSPVLPTNFLDELKNAQQRRGQVGKDPIQTTSSVYTTYSNAERTTTVAISSDGNAAATTTGQFGIPTPPPLPIFTKAGAIPTKSLTKSTHVYSTPSWLDELKRIQSKRGKFDPDPETSTIPVSMTSSLMATAN